MYFQGGGVILKTEFCIGSKAMYFFRHTEEQQMFSSYVDIKGKKAKEINLVVKKVFRDCYGL